MQLTASRSQAAAARCAPYSAAITHRAASARPRGVGSRQQQRASGRVSRAAATAAAPLGAGTPEPALAALEKPSTSGRKLVFAVDGTPSCEEALRWVVRNIARKGDYLYLAHVICDPRTPSTAVGSSAAATQWSPARDEQRFAKEYLLRLEHEAMAMLQGRFIPDLQFTGIEHEPLLLRLKVHKSAGGIGEAICTKAKSLGADMVLIASHGAGVLADYGSVARWCSDNSTVPALLLPPAVMEPEAAGKPPAPCLLVAATDNMEGLKASLEFALQKLARPGDSVYVVHAKEQQGSTEEAEIAARKQLVSSITQWQAESTAPAAPLVNIACDLILGTSSPDDLSEASVGAQLCKAVEDLNVRSVVLAHQGKNMMREMVWGPAQMHVTKQCSRPLVVLQ